MKKVFKILSICVLLLGIICSCVYAEETATRGTSYGSRVTRPSTTSRGGNIVISDVKVKVTEPVYGKTLDYNVTMETTGLTVDSVIWQLYNSTRNGYTYLNTDHVVGEGKYRVKVLFKVNDGYTLSSDLTTGTINSDSNCQLILTGEVPALWSNDIVMTNAVNTRPATSGTVTRPSTGSSVSRTSNYLKSVEITMDDVSINKELPKSLQITSNLNSTPSTVTINPTVRPSTATNTTKATLTPKDEKAQFGTTYTLTVKSTVPSTVSGVSDPFTATVNGKEAQTKYESGEITITYQFKMPTKAEILEGAHAVIGTQLTSGDLAASGLTPISRVSGEATSSETAKSGETTTTEPAKSGEATTTEPAKSGEATTTGKEDADKLTWTKASDWAKTELEQANEAGLIPSIFNKEDMTKNITRKEFAHVAVKLYEKISGQKAIAVASNPFTDTKDEEVLKAYNVGITTGTSATTFNPDALITREQMATMMARALAKAGIDTTVDLNKVTKFADDAEMHDWGRASIYYMSNIEIIKGIGDNKFGVTGNATREQSIAISRRSVEKLGK